MRRSGLSIRDPWGPDRIDADRCYSRDDAPAMQLTLAVSPGASTVSYGVSYIAQLCCS